MHPIAQTILTQLGGRRFLAMTGARDLVASETSLAMRLPIGKARNLRIELAADDTYTVKSLRWNRTNLQYGITAIASGVYADSLRDVVEGMTDLLVGL